MPLDNAPIKSQYTYKKMPEGWATVTETQVYSRSSSATVVYNTPRFKGTVLWRDDQYIYGELACWWKVDDKEYLANEGHDLGKLLGIPEDYYIRTGKDGWMKLLTRPYFEFWLKQDLPVSEWP